MGVGEWRWHGAIEEKEMQAQLEARRGLDQRLTGQEEVTKGREVTEGLVRQ